MSPENFDVIVIGAGLAMAIAAAIRAAQLKQKAVIVDKQWSGGVFGVRGCIPVHAVLLKNASVARTTRAWQGF
ncbi:MAG: hypothetical protein U0V48_13280 [Anaerolineales bacterium]